MDGQFGTHNLDNAASSSPAPPPLRAVLAPIGAVLEIAGSSSKVMLDPEALEALAGNPDAVVANGGQVGAQIKVRVGATWLIANIRSL